MATSSLTLRTTRALRGAVRSQVVSPFSSSRTSATPLPSFFARFRQFSTETGNGAPSEKANEGADATTTNNTTTTDGKATNGTNGNNALEAKLKEVEKSCGELQKSKKDLEDKMLRLLADNENIRKTTSRDMERAKKYALQPFAKDLIITIDNLKRALASVPAEMVGEASTHNDLKNLYEGVKMTREELVKACQKHSLVEFEPLGQKFDPSQHMALFNIPDTTKPHGTVGNVVETGYLLHDRVIRPARVGVVQNPSTSSTPPPAQSSSEGGNQQRS